MKLEKSQQNFEAMDSLSAPLSKKEKMVLEYIESYLMREGMSPSYQEIREHFGFASLNSVQKYLQQLQRKSYIALPGGNQKRAINLLKSSDSLQNHLRSLREPSIPHRGTSLKSATTLRTSAESLSLPLFGRVAAGQPLEAFEHDEFVDVPGSMVRRSDKTFALRVEGQSMIEDGIFDGDIILVEETSHVANGQIVVATIDNEATVKRFFKHSDDEQIRIELRPSNSEMKSLWYEPRDVHIRGVVVGLIRSF